MPGSTKGEEFPGRRRWLVAGARLPLLVMGATLAEGRPARAEAAVPAAVAELDAAAAPLFDAVESGLSTEAEAALGRAHRAAASAGAAEIAYTEAGGQLSDFYQARNALSGDLAEADIALSVKDRRWLIACSERLLSRAGELAAPFVGHRNPRMQTLEALLFLARRMRRAAVWRDPDGLAAAGTDFRRLWLDLRPHVDASTPGLAVIDAAVKGLGRSTSGADARVLTQAVEALWRSLG